MRYINAYFQRTPKLTLVDAILWSVSIQRAKSLGYTTVLYTNGELYEYLKKLGIADYYDEVQLTLLDLLLQSSPINTEVFWNFPKLAAIQSEVTLKKGPFLIADTDLILNRPIDQTNEAYVWSSDYPDGNEYSRFKQIYLKWSDLTMPANFQLPDYIAQNFLGAYNTGIIYIKSTDVATEYALNALAFMINNPAAHNRNNHLVYACKAEQNIIWAVFNKNGVLPHTLSGTDIARHFYVERFNVASHPDEPIVKNFPALLALQQESRNSLLQSLSLNLPGKFAISFAD